MGLGSLQEGKLSSDPDAPIKSGRGTLLKLPEPSHYEYDIDSTSLYITTFITVLACFAHIVISSRAGSSFHSAVRWLL